MEVDKFTRKITHTFSDYSSSDQDSCLNRGEYSTNVDKIIIKRVRPTPLLPSNSDIINDEYYIYSDSGLFFPIFAIATSVILLCILFIGNDEPLSWIHYIIALISISTASFFTYFIFTKPEKGRILDRQRGRLTFSGFLYQKPITMDFEDVIFTYTTGEDDGMGAFMLQLVRPNKYWITTHVYMDLFGDFAESISYHTWYMDKNRPLPPGTAFDPYRQKDFDRRKAEGFPKPLYPARFETPEATPQQQAEREQIGGW